MRSIIIQMQFPNRLSRMFTISAEEFKCYLLSDKKTLRNFRIATKIPESMSESKAYSLFCDGLIENFNKFSKSGLYKLKLLKFTSDQIVSDSTLNRLDIALYYADNPAITAKIAKIIDKYDKILTCCHLNSIEEIQQKRAEKLKFVENISIQKRGVSTWQPANHT